MSERHVKPSGFTSPAATAASRAASPATTRPRCRHPATISLTTVSSVGCDAVKTPVASRSPADVKPAKLSTMHVLVIIDAVDDAVCVRVAAANNADCGMDPLAVDDRVGVSRR